MKKALLAAALMSAGVVAHAQSSVTLYGRLDAGVEYISGLPNANYTGSTSRFRVESGDWGTSLWGMKGVEDIGGGNKVLFQLEGSFSTATGSLGSAGSIWNRWATVGVANDQFGTFLLGRELFISNGVWDFDPFGQSNWSSASLVRGRNWPQSSNNISYQSPKFYGFDVYGQYAFSNSTSFNGGNGSAQGREDGLQVTYTNSLFQVRGLYDEIRNNINGSLGDPTAGAPNGPFNYGREYFRRRQRVPRPVQDSGCVPGARTSGQSGVPIGHADDDSTRNGAASRGKQRRQQHLSQPCITSTRTMVQATRTIYTSAVRTTCPSVRCSTPDRYRAQQQDG
jgi:predicted porin